MSKIMNYFELLGNTPLVCLTQYCRVKKLKANILAKLEMFNPTGSVKARIAAAMIEESERQGLLKSGSTIIEPTSGNTGIALAALAAAKGYKIILTMPASMSEERRKILSAYGAELVLCSDMQSAVLKAEELNGAIANSFMPSQFSNPANPAAHKKTTGVEIWEDTGGCVDIFVAGVGTGGTISGAGALLKEKNPKVSLIAVEPADSPVLGGGSAGKHRLEGIGAGFIPATLNTSIIDEVIAVDTDSAVLTASDIARTDGILVGISSGAALFAATQVAQRAENAGKTIVTIFPDGGEKYLSTILFHK